MAQLKIKNFPDELHKLLLERATQKRLSVSQVVIRLLTEAVEPSRPRSILELRGLGKSVWAGIEASRFVSQERDGWG